MIKVLRFSFKMYPNLIFSVLLLDCVTFFCSKKYFLFEFHRWSKSMFRKMTHYDLIILKKKLLNTNLTDAIISLLWVFF